MPSASQLSSARRPHQPTWPSRRCFPACRRFDTIIGNRGATGNKKSRRSRRQEPYQPLGLPPRSGRRWWRSALLFSRRTASISARSASRRSSRAISPAVSTRRSPCRRARLARRLDLAELGRHKSDHIARLRPALQAVRSGRQRSAMGQETRFRLRHYPRGGAPGRPPASASFTSPAPRPIRGRSTCLSWPSSCS